MLMALSLQLVLCASYARGSSGDYRDYVFEDLGRKSTDNYYSEFENLGKMKLGKKLLDGVNAVLDFKVSSLWKGTTERTFQRFPDGLDELTIIQGVATTPFTFVKPPVHFDHHLTGTRSSRSRKMKRFGKNRRRGKEQNGAKKGRNRSKKGKNQGAGRRVRKMHNGFGNRNSPGMGRRGAKGRKRKRGMKRGRRGRQQMRRARWKKRGGKKRGRWKMRNRSGSNKKKWRNLQKRKRVKRENK